MNKSLKGKRILITGASGFIGSCLIKKLVSEKTHILALSHPGLKSKRLPELRRQIDFASIDLSNFKQLRKKIHRFRPQIIYHFATYGNHPEHYQNSFADFFTKITQINVLNFINLMRCVADIPFELFVNTGSAFAEYGQGKTKFKETQALSPNTLYGATKASATLLLQNFGQQLKRNTITFRPTYVYGPGEDLKRFVPVVIRKGLEGKPLSLTSAKETKDFIFIDDVVQAYYLAAIKQPAGNHVLNLGVSAETTLGEVIKMVENLIQKKIHYKEGTYQKKSWHGQCWAADTQRAKSILHWHPRFTLRRGIQATIKWVRSLID